MPNRRRRQSAFEPAEALGGVIARHPREFVAIVMATAATLAIFVNALFLQHGPHPAPIFATRPLMHRQSAVVLPPPRAAQAAPVPVAEPARSQAQIIAGIQRALAARGLYDGAVDGIWGVKTDAAARDFAQTAGLKIIPEPNESLLRAIAAAPAKSVTTQAVTPASAPTRNDPIATIIAPSKRVLAIQRALADFGYGQIKPTGVYDQDTRAAIEKFQSDRGLPIDGRITDDFVRSLAAMTGRPLE
ncbi:MAG: peptidoglycan-binding domain-containing protein [Stellaceae bacterium]